MNALSTIATNSLLGTDRRPPQWPVHEGPLGGLLGSLDRTAPEKALLQTAGILGTCHLAGWKPPSVPDTAVPCPPDTRPHQLPAPLQESLGSILADGPVRLQAEVFMKLAAAGYNLPHRSLPQALNGARSSKALCAFLLPVLGQRGAWLAAQNEYWNYAAGWAAALTRQKKVSWADAFLSTELPFNQSLNHVELLETLPLAQREKHFLRLFESALQGQSASSSLDRFLASMPVDSPLLSHEAASQLLRVLKKYVNSGSARYDWQLRNSLVELACVLPTSLFGEAASGWDLTKEEVQPFAEAVARLSTVLDQRQQWQSFKPVI